MEFSLPLPSALAKDGVLSRQWTNFYCRFQCHGNVGFSQDPQMQITSVLLYTVYNEISSICESLKMFDMDMFKLNKVLEVIEQACLPRFILLFERFRCFTLEQDASESLNDFMNVVRKQVELCEFDKVKESVMTSVLVNSVTDESFKQSMQDNGLCYSDFMTASSENNTTNSSAIYQGTSTSKSQKGHKRKVGAKVSHVGYEKNMYIVPCYENLNEEADTDDHIVKTVVDMSRSKSKVTKKQKTGPTAGARVKQFLCFICDNEYASRKSFRKHIAAKHKDCQEHFCRHCNMTFSSRTECITHCQGHNTTPQTSAKTHSWKDANNTEFLCWLCEMTFPNLPDYKKHCLTHSAVRVFTCELCQKKNHTIIRMIGHLKGHLSPRHKCEICASCFGRPELLQAHLQTHAAQPLHQCPVCAKSFVSSHGLQGHMRTHSGEKLFVCELCGKSFFQRMSLVYHKRWHAGEKPYECDICGRRTRCFGDLRKHKRMHSDKRPYVCEVCGKSFRFISSLNRHRRGHSGKRSFACDVCGRTFIYGEGLRDHIKAGRCPGRKNAENRTSRAPRTRAPSLLSHHQQPNIDCNPINYTTSHRASEVGLHEFPSSWQYMLRTEPEELIG